MIEVRELVHTMLYNLGEMYNRKHSDEEFINSINMMLRYLNIELINHESWYITKEIELTPKNGKVPLPKDFAKFRSFTEEPDKYKFLQKTLHVQEPVEMQYMYTLLPVESIEDVIDLPYIFFDMIVKFSEGLVKRNLDGDAVAHMIGKEVEKMLQNDSGGPIERPMEFYV